MLSLEKRLLVRGFLCKKVQQKQNYKELNLAYTRPALRDSVGSRKPEGFPAKEIQEEHRVVNDACHKVSHDILSWAKSKKADLAMEDLTGIRNVTRRGNRNGNRTINSWPFYKLRTMIEYKCGNYGIKTVFIDPRYTSQDCCVCGDRWKTTTKKYVKAVVLKPIGIIMQQ